MKRAAEAGSPEALTLLGRWYERGIGVPKNQVLAAALYLRAMHLDGMWAPGLLWDLVHRENFFKDLHARVDKDEPEALFTWAQLVAVEFDHQITEEQALGFLRKSADQKFPPAMIELGMCYASGRWVKEDKEEARKIFEAAEEAGSQEARVRLAMMSLAGEGAGKKNEAAIATLREAEAKGSILAQSMLGYCYEAGLGTAVNTPEAIREYREASGRGSKTAYASLRRMYDGLRPGDAEFRIENR
jgi:TPR repeat protein